MGSIPDQLRRASRVAVALTASGCGAPSCDTSGFEELVTREPRAIELPGVEFARVEDFTPLQALGRAGDVDAIAGVDAAGNVEIVRRDGTSCTATTLSDAPASTRLVPAASLDLLVTMAHREDAGGSGPLRIFDVDCAEVLAFETARPLAGSERLVPFRLLLLEGARLLSLDPETRQVETVERKVVSAQVVGKHVLVLTEEELVVLDLALDEIARHGSAVSEFLPLSAGRLVLIDDGDLELLDEVDGEARRLDRGVCDISLANGPGAAADRFLAYHSPCDGAALVVFDVEEAARIEVGPSATARAAVHPGADGPLIFSQAPLGDEATALLWVGSGDDREALGPGTLAGVGTRDDDGTVWLWLAEGGRGPLLRWSEDGMDTAYEQVVGFDPSPPERALVEEDGVTSLVSLRGFPDVEVLATPASHLGRSGPKASLLFEDGPEGTATLRLWRPGAETVSVAEGVQPASANFWFTGETLVYLEHWDAAALEGRFCLRILANGDEFCEPSIASFRVMNRPERGVALVRRSGSREHLFWAAIR